MWGILVALISGALMSVQEVFNIGAYQTKQFVGFHGLGAVFRSSCMYCSVVFHGKTKHSSTGKGGTQVYFAGRCDWCIITITVIQSMSALGPAKAAMLIVVAQLAVAYLIELMGMFGVEKAGFQWRKLIGMAVAIAGIVIFKWEK